MMVFTRLSHQICKMFDVYHYEERLGILSFVFIFIYNCADKWSPSPLVLQSHTKLKKQITCMVYFDVMYART